MARESYPNYDRLPHEEAKRALAAAICGTAFQLADEATLFETAPAGLMVDDVDDPHERFARVLAMSSPTFSENHREQEGDMETNVVLMRVDLAERTVEDVLSIGVRMVQGSGIYTDWNREPEQEEIVSIDKLVGALNSGRELDPTTRSVVSEHMLDELRTLYPIPAHLLHAESEVPHLDTEVTEALDRFLEGPREGDPSTFVERFYSHAGGRYFIALSSIDLLEGPEVTVEICDMRSWEYDALRYVRAGHSDGESFTFTDEYLQQVLLKFLETKKQVLIAKHDFESVKNQIIQMPLAG